VNFILKIYDLFSESFNAANPLVTWMSNFVERNLGWKMLKFKRYNYFLKALQCSGRVRKMIKPHHSAQQTKTWAMKELGDLWQHYTNLQEILSDCSQSEN
jgi:hypothetical protein